MCFHHHQKKVVVQEIAKGVGLKFVQAVADVTTKNKLDQETREKVQEFYQSDEISWQAPGIKDRYCVFHHLKLYETGLLRFMAHYLL